MFRDGCPNLLWELMPTRREQLSAAQLMRKNPTEAIVDKDNHDVRFFSELQRLLLTDIELMLAYVVVCRWSSHNTPFHLLSICLVFIYPPVAHVAPRLLFATGTYRH